MRGDGYPEHARQELRLVLHGAAPPVVLLDGGEVPAPGGRLAFPNAGAPFRAEFDG